MKLQIPINVIHTLSTLNKHGFEGYVVGGCVRDLFSNREPKDWDITTNATPEQLQEIFPDSVYENDFGTVGVKTIKPGTAGETEIVEITTYRIESTYTDRRHPDEIKFAKTLREDLSRRDFTMNALAVKVKEVDALLMTADNSAASLELTEKEAEIVDYFGGREDLRNKIIKAVGEAGARFDEDALRMMRAIRFAVQLGFHIEAKTFAAIKEHHKNIQYVSKERIRDEFSKLLLSSNPDRGIDLLHEAGLLKEIIPELEAGYDVTQSHHHYYGPYNTVYKHLVASLEKCPSEKLEVRLAALFHDIGKPETKQGDGEHATFYNHEYVGARITKNILQRLKFPPKVIDKAVLLVKNHMFYYNVDEVGESGVRRVVRKVGLENINDLIDVRIADRLGSGVPKAVPYKLRHFKFMVDKVSHDPLSAKQLKLNGDDLIKELEMVPGPKIGAILDVLLAKVIEEPEINEREALLSLARELEKEDLAVLREYARDRIEEENEREVEQMKGKYKVK